MLVESIVAALLNGRLVTRLLAIAKKADMTVSTIKTVGRIDETLITGR